MPETQTGIPCEVDGEFLYLSPNSAEGKALQRLPDIDCPTKWVTLVEEEQEIDIEPGLERLSKRGYKVQIPSPDTSLSAD
jgi:hypothetical protein